MQFGSDNHTGASRAVLEMILKANDGHTPGYGNDAWTARAVQALREVFECELDAYFVGTGTAANCLALSCLVQPWEVVLCHDEAHILADESTAPELFTGGARLQGISLGADKITPAHLQRYLALAGKSVPHNPRARALSLSQAAENGLVYSPDELKVLCTLAHEHGLLVHMDGARFANAVAAQDCAPADLTWRAGVDVLCLGASKNGALAAEAVLFFKPALGAQFADRRKRAGHLLSKGRFYGAQFAGWLEDGHWLDLARHANAQARNLAAVLQAHEAVSLAWEVAANEVFAVMPAALLKHLQAQGVVCYEWPRRAGPDGLALRDDQVVSRMVTSFVTQDADIAAFAGVLRAWQP
jgi:threonine aldolase